MEMYVTEKIILKNNLNLTEILTKVATVVVNTSGVDEWKSPFGPQRDSMFIVIPVTIVYTLIFLTGIIGNTCTCIVIYKNKSMHTATNYYLFSLSVSDLLLLISGLPIEIYMVWCKYPYIFGEGFCILRGLAAECSTNASVLTITAFTAERYIAICHPFLSHTMSKLSRAIKLILIIWLIALLFAIPQALQFGIINYQDNNPDYVICTLRTIVIKHSFELSTLLFFILPMTIITVLYTMIAFKLKKSNAMKRKNINIRVHAYRGCQTNRKKRFECKHQTGKSSRRVLKMLVAVVVAFFICWAPFHVQRLIAIYGTESDHVTSKNQWMGFLYLIFTYISGMLYYVSTTINPILYNIMSNKFRGAFKETLGKKCGGSRTSGQQEPKSYSSLSRSQQRTLGRIFGSRTVGTSGDGTAVIAQESSDCSGNLLRDANNQQSLTLSSQNQPQTQINNINNNNSCDIRKIDIPNTNEHLSSTTTPTSSSTSSSYSFKQSKRKLKTNEDKFVFDDCTKKQIITDEFYLKNNDTSNYFKLSYNRNPKKYWRIFQFQFTQSKINNDVSEPVEMATCYIHNSVEHQIL